jgi:hypothetical protein
LTRSTRLARVTFGQYDVVEIGGTYDLLYLDVTCDGITFRISVVFLIVAEISELMHCITKTITSVLFIGFRCTNNCWKDEEVNYDVDIESFLRLHLVWGQKFRFLRLLNYAQNIIPAVRSNLKNHNS